MSSDASAWQRQPGQGRYARPERERRFLLASDPPAGDALRTIEDRYLDGTRLRLRRVTGAGSPVFKLTQKVRLSAEDPAEVALTNTYLSAEEYDVLAGLPGRVLTKTRRVCRVEEWDFVVDAFQGRLSGLLLAEVEVDDLHAQLPRPPWLGREVTHEDRYSGGALAYADDRAIRRLLGSG